MRIFRSNTRKEKGLIPLVTVVILYAIPNSLRIKVSHVRPQNSFLFELMPCALEALTVIQTSVVRRRRRRRRRSPIGPWPKPRKKPRCNPTKTKPNKHTPKTKTNQTKHHGCTQVRGEKVKRRALTLCTQPCSS